MYVLVNSTKDYLLNICQGGLRMKGISQSWWKKILIICYFELDSLENFCGHGTCGK